MCTAAEIFRERLRREMQFCELPPPPRPSPALGVYIGRRGGSKVHGGIFDFRRPFGFENHVFIPFKLRFQTAFRISGRFEAV